MTRDELGDVVLRRAGRCAWLQLRRPERLNAVRPETLDQLSAALDLAEADPAVSVLLLSGQGRAFCAGADLGFLQEAGPVELDRFLARGQEVFARMSDGPLLSVAVVHGFAVGGGFELALCCDLRVAAPGAVVGTPEATLGHLPSWGASYHLARLAGRSAALRLIVEGAKVPVEEAERLGLVDLVTPGLPPGVLDGEDPEALGRTAVPWALDRDPRLVRWAKESVRAGEGGGRVASARSERAAAAHLLVRRAFA